ncbi:MAG: hypothetical protein ACI835_004970 [Planctomycetota bacterium]|jgi:hypothetical protein
MHEKDRAILEPFVPSLPIDADRVVNAGRLPNSTMALFYQGTTAIGAPLGDGLRCVGGSILRLALRQADRGGLVSAIGLPLHQLGGVSMGSARFYQC